MQAYRTSKSPLLAFFSLAQNDTGIKQHCVKTIAVVIAITITSH